MFHLQPDIVADGIDILAAYSKLTSTIGDPSDNRFNIYKVQLMHTLTNPFLEKFYWELKKMSKLFQFLIKLFPKMVYYCVPLGHTLVKSMSII